MIRWSPTPINAFPGTDDLRGNPTLAVDLGDGPFRVRSISVESTRMAQAGPPPTRGSSIRQTRCYLGTTLA